MGSVEVAATWYGGGRESMRGGSGEASGVARTAAAPLLQRQGARRGGEGCREHLHQVLLSSLGRSWSCDIR
uniref:Uncharacterized protein n=1 Tax=Oryza barthii TaxID=65489 RepID=A0A0D3HTL2_9ORYZ